MCLITNRFHQLMIMSIMTILSSQGGRCSFTPVRGRQVRAGTPSPLYQTRSPPPAGFLVWLDHVEKSNFSSSSPEFSQFWNSVETMILPVSTSESMNIHDMNQENDLSLHSVNDTSELLENSSMTYRHPLMIAGVEVGLSNSDVLSACSWAAENIVDAANSMEEMLEYQSSPIQSICQLRLDIDEDWPSAQVEVFLRLRHSELVDNLRKSMSLNKEASFDDLKGLGSDGGILRHSCEWEANLYSHDSFERIARYGSEGNLEYVYGGVDLEDDTGSFTESDWSSLPISGQTIMMELVLRASTGKGCEMADKPTLETNRNLLPTIQLVETVVSNASALQPRLVGMNPGEIISSLKSESENRGHGSIAKEGKSAMQVSAETQAFCNSASCHVDVTCDQSFSEERNGVVKLFLGSKVCSGTLITDPEANRLLILTARHCLPNNVNTAEAAFWKAVFLFERQCNNACESPNAILFQGLETLWADIGTDTALLRIIGNGAGLAAELGENGVYYNGWDRTSNHNPGTASCIHHPVGDVKKITVDYSFTLSSKELTYNQYTMYNWDQGSIQPGSSGSPLFSGLSKRVMGVLSGVDQCTFANACGYQQGQCAVVFALFPKLGVAWNGPSGLGAVLSPSNPDLMFMDGSSQFFGVPVPGGSAPGGSAPAEPDGAPFQIPTQPGCPSTSMYPPGDVNYSGFVDVIDLVTILANLVHAQDPNKNQVLLDAGVNVLTPCEMAALDFDGNGETNIVDYAQLTLCVQELISPCVSI